MSSTGSILPFAELGRFCGVPCGPTSLRTNKVRLKRKPGLYVAYGLDLIASIAVFLTHSLTIDTVLSTTMSVLAVLGCHKWTLELSMSLSFSILSVGVVFPITVAVQQAFNRREVALKAIVQLRCFALVIFTAHRCWDWPDGKGNKAGGRLALPKDHIARVTKLLESIFEAVET